MIMINQNQYYINHYFFQYKNAKKVDELCFLYGGQFIDKNFTYFNLSNSIDKERKTISIIVTDDEQKN